LSDSTIISFPTNSTPLDWFELTITITLTISVYVKVGIFINLGFVKVDITIFEIRKDFNIVILGPLKLTPSPFGKVGRVSSSGLLSLQMTDLLCESKGGSVGAEEIQCWEAGKDTPVIMTFTNVKALSGGGLNRRRLTSANEVDASNDRRLQSSTFQFNCISSELDLSGTSDILINYERCPISSGTFEIGLAQAIGVGVVRYSSSLNTANVILPSPIQDTLTTVVRDCNAQWTLDGYTNVLIYGSEVQSGCQIIANGSSDANAILTIDFGQLSCSSGHSVTLNEGSVVIDGNEIVAFDASFKDIILAGSNCADQFTITKTYDDTSSIEILGYDGSDTIILGDSSAPFDTDIVGNIIVDGGAGSDTLTIHDQGSTASKPDVAVRPTMISGVHADSAHSVAYFDVENINMSLGTVASQVTVHSTAAGVSLTLTTQGKCSLHS
jgi:hypothetical protein